MTTLEKSAERVACPRCSRKVQVRCEAPARGAGLVNSLLPEARAWARKLTPHSYPWVCRKCVRELNDADTKILHDAVNAYAPKVPLEYTSWAGSYEYVKSLPVDERYLAYVVISQRQSKQFEVSELVRASERSYLEEVMSTAPEVGEVRVAFLAAVQAIVDREPSLSRIVVGNEISLILDDALRELHFRDST